MNPDVMIALIAFMQAATTGWLHWQISKNKPTCGIEICQKTIKAAKANNEQGTASEHTP